MVFITVRLYAAMKNKEKLMEYCHKLLVFNPDDASLYGQLEACLSDQTNESLLALYKDLETKYTRSAHVQTRILELLPATDPEWQSRVGEALKKGLRKGVPSLFTSVKRLWFSGDSAKKDWVRGTVEGYVASLEKRGTFDDDEHGERETPTALPWSLLFLSLLYDSDGRSDDALVQVDKGIEHTPTLVELHMTRGRVLKRAGRIQDAADALQEARELDLQDRFVNTKCTKYLLRAGRFEDAEKVVVLFTRAESTDPLGDMIEQQVLWWATEGAEMFARKGEWGKAMKRWYQIEKVSLGLVFWVVR